MKRLFISFLIVVMIPVIDLSPVFAQEEVSDPSHSQVILRDHPQTGNPYVSIVSSESPVPPDPFTGQKKYSRPDYRMLDPKVKKEQYQYDGPVSDRKKVYIFAASLMTAGTVTGAVGIATAPVTAGAATGGAGYTAAGAVLAGGAVTAALVSQRKKPLEQDFTHTSESRTLEEKAQAIELTQKR